MLFPFKPGTNEGDFRLILNYLTKVVGYKKNNYKNHDIFTIDALLGSLGCRDIQANPLKNILMVWSTKIFKFLNQWFP